MTSLNHHIVREFDTHSNGICDHGAPCCHPARTEIWTLNKGLINVEDIEIDDILINNGNPEKIINIYERQYNGSIYKLNIQDVYGDIWFTEEHPIVAMSQCHRTEISLDRFKWKNIKDIKKASRVLSISNDRKGLRLDKEFLYLCGFYLGDGTYNSKHDEVQFTCNINTSESHDIKKRLEKYYKREARKYDYPKKSYTSIRLSNCTDFFDLFGTGFQNKKLPEKWMKDISRIEFDYLFSGFFDSDGWRENFKYDQNNKYISISNEYLMKQFYLLCSCLGYSSRLVSASNVDFKDRNKKVMNRWILRVSINKNAKNSVKIGNNIIRSVKDIETKQYNGLVYGFETESGEYDNLFKVHNCPHSISGEFVNTEDDGWRINNRKPALKQGTYITTIGCPHCETSFVVDLIHGCEAGTNTLSHSDKKEQIRDVDTVIHEWGVTYPSSWSPDTGC